MPDDTLIAAQHGTVTVALIGNPNTGKSTLFSALVGIRQRVGNFPGVTVEKKSGHARIGDHHFTIIDLPGTYSLAPRSPDEMIAVDFLLGRRDDLAIPDVVICIVDASNLERNLYLLSQVLELGRPTVIALNMVDIAAAKGLLLDIGLLRERLGVPVIEIQANRKIGVESLKEALVDAVAVDPCSTPSPFPEAFQREVDLLQDKMRESNGDRVPRYLVERLLLDVSGYIEHADLSGSNGNVLHDVNAARRRLSQAGCPIPAVEATARYGWAARVLDGVITRPSEPTITLTDRIDGILTHRFWGAFVFVVMMVLLFQSVFYVAEPASAAIDWLNGTLGSWVKSTFSDGALRALLLGGVIEGVGGVLVFLPQIFILFFFIAILEDCGYLARAAYLMDKLMSRVGLSGKSFIPLLSSFACAVPGIMSARVIEDRRDRLVTILVAPLMSCSARLPVYVLLIAAFIPNERIGVIFGLQGLTMFAMYSIGIIVAIGVALMLKKTILKGSPPSFIMELPSYKFPSPGVVLHRMFDRGWAFVRRAGTLIFAVAIVVWAAAYYPRDLANVDATLLARQSEVKADVAQLQNQTAGPSDSETLAAELQAHRAELARLDNQIDGELLANSYLGRAGHFVEPIVRPLGWDWRIGCAVLASFPAREVVVATLGVIYHQGSEVDEQSQSLRDTLKSATWEGTDKPVFNIPVALSIMVFFALCAQCASTLVIIRRETGSWQWPAFTFVYMTLAAYGGAWLTYQLGMFCCA